MAMKDNKDNKIDIVIDGKKVKVNKTRYWKES